MGICIKFMWKTFPGNISRGEEKWDREGKKPIQGFLLNKLKL
jgi:hypothetical protein